jgi:hypothetical protein
MDVLTDIVHDHTNTATICHSGLRSYHLQFKPAGYKPRPERGLPGLRVDGFLLGGCPLRQWFVQNRVDTDASGQI